MRLFRICYDVFILLIVAIELLGSGTHTHLTLAFWCAMGAFGIYDLLLRLCLKRTKGSLIFKLLPVLIGLGMIISGVAKLDDCLLLIGILFEDASDIEEQSKWPPQNTIEDNFSEDNWC